MVRINVGMFYQEDMRVKDMAFHHTTLQQLVAKRKDPRSGKAFDKMLRRCRRTYRKMLKGEYVSTGFNPQQAAENVNCGSRVEQRVKAKSDRQFLKKGITMEALTSITGSV